jgi:uncharacterized membrane protein YdcZ (DUF606 family)
MRALSFIGMVLAAFLLFLGFSSRQKAGAVLSNAIIVGGAIIAGFVIIVWIITFLKEKRK